MGLKNSATNLGRISLMSFWSGGVIQQFLCNWVELVIYHSGEGWEGLINYSFMPVPPGVVGIS